MESVCEESTAAPDRNQKGGGGEHLIKDLKRKANSLSRDTRQANALGLEEGPPPLPPGTAGTARVRPWDLQCEVSSHPHLKLTSMGRQPVSGQFMKCAIQLTGPANASTASLLLLGIRFSS